MTSIPIHLNWKIYFSEHICVSRLFQVWGPWWKTTNQHYNGRSTYSVYPLLQVGLSKWSGLQGGVVCAGCLSGNALGLTPVERRGKPDWTEGGVQLQSRPNHSICQTHGNLEQKNPMSEVPCLGSNDWATLAHHDQ